MSVAAQIVVVCRAYRHVESRDTASNLVFGVSYEYDAAGMITQKVSRTAGASNVVAYAYDELDRLIREDDGATAREYDYDLAGNRLAMRVIAGGATNATAYTLGTGNRLDSWTGGACAYDIAGCVTNLARSGKPTVALEWDAQYRVTAAYTNGVLAESYGYDALGHRATVTANGVATHFVNEGPHVIAETDAAGNLQRRYEYGPGVDDILSMTVFSGGGTNTYYYIKDLLNTVLAIQDGAGAIVEFYEYDAWGNVLAVRDGAGNPLPESAIGNRYLFQGREYSWATGLYNFRARWFDPETGRWLSNDPIGISGGLNQYEFCANNPAIFIDPLGLDLPGLVPENSKGIGSVVNDTPNTYQGAASTRRHGDLRPYTFTPNPVGQHGGSSAAEHGDADFIYPTPETPINGKTNGAFKIGANDAHIYVDGKGKVQIINFRAYWDHDKAKSLQGYPCAEK